MRIFDTPESLVAAVGERLGESGYRPVLAAEILRFAELTGDRQWIHTDPDAARAGPFGGLVAHGFLTLSLLTTMLDEVLTVRGADLVVNKGLDRLRFGRPILVGADLRIVADLAEAAIRPKHFTEAVIAVRGEVRGQPGWAYSARLRLLFRRATPTLATPTVATPTVAAPTPATSPSSTAAGFTGR